MKTHVIIGTAAAGIGCLNTLVKFDPHSRIICISDETEKPYNKCFLADYVHKVKQENELNILRNEIINHPNFHLFLGMRVVAIDSALKTITLADETIVPYDTLFIGTGSSPIIPPLPGISTAQGVFTFHTLADVHKILAYVNDHAVTRVTIIGGGLSGLECADSLRARGLEVIVIERGDRVLARQVDQEGAAVIAKLMANAGIELRCNAFVNKEEVQDKEMFIIATGLKPNVELARSANLELCDGYIAVDDYMCTSDPNIFAGGDCVMVYDQVSKRYAPSCTWPDAMQQGSVAAFNMISSHSKKYPGSCVITSSAFFGTSFVTCGPVVDVPDNAEIRISHGDGFYHKIILVDGKVAGYLLIGNTQIASKLKRMMLTGERL